MRFAECQLSVTDRDPGIARSEETDVIPGFIELCDPVCAFNGFYRPLVAALWRLGDIKTAVRSRQPQ